MVQPWAPPSPPGNGHGSSPRPLCEWVGWLWMGGVDGVESCGLCKEFD